jgi:hypothetical protein
LLYVRADRSLTDASTTIDVPGVDSTAALIRRLFVGAVDAARVGDPAGGYLTNLLTCPTLAQQVSQRSDEDAARLLASRCNFR